jgi:AcrR family transcriptional regulator
VEQIVEMAGVAKGTVYYHFKSKDELFQALLIEGLNRLAEAFGEVVENSSDAVEALSGIVGAELMNIDRYRAFARLMMSQIWRADSLWSAQAVRMLDEDILDVVEGVLKKGREDGRFRSDLDTRMAAGMIFGTVAMAALGHDRAVERPVEQLLPQLQGIVRGMVA